MTDDEIIDRLLVTLNLGSQSSFGRPTKELVARIMMLKLSQY